MRDSLIDIQKVNKKVLSMHLNQECIEQCIIEHIKRRVPLEDFDTDEAFTKQFRFNQTDAGVTGFKFEANVTMEQLNHENS